MHHGVVDRKDSGNQCQTAKDERSSTVRKSESPDGDESCWAEIIAFFARLAALAEGGVLMV